MRVAALIAILCVAPACKRAAPAASPEHAPRTDAQTATDQGDVFGLDGAFGRHLQAHATSSTTTLKARAPAFGAPLPKDQVRAAKYLDRIVKPASHGAARPERALNDDERATLERQGFVVSERLGATSHAQLLRTVYEHDQPVFISADSVLHAWHMSYDKMLEELEVYWLSSAIDRMLEGMSKELPAMKVATKGGALEDATRDADVFIAVARSLLGGAGGPSPAPNDDPFADPSSLVVRAIAPIDPSNADDVTALLDAIKAERKQQVELFGRTRDEDFSQMKPRGHYTKSELLKRYFRAMMWIGRTEMRVAGPEGSARELAGAIVLHDLLSSSKQLETWTQIDRLLQTYVGRSDCMGPPDVGALLTVSGIKDTRALDKAQLEGLQKRLLDSRLGLQQINSAIRYSDPSMNDRVELPRSFALMGQRFTVDSWLLGQVVFDNITIDGQKVQRLMPSGVDVAFGAFGNDAAAPIIAQRIDDKRGYKKRDGLRFEPNLLAARQTIDEMPRATWDRDLYGVWLGALRALSEPTTSTAFPTVMRTEAWSQRVMQAQLSSWAELRHDTILYAKQSYGAGVACEYPAGFVELAPAFWQKMNHAARLAQKLLVETPVPEKEKELQREHVEHWKKFADVTDRLMKIVDKERESLPLSADEEKWLRQAVEVSDGGCGPPAWDGWYLSLYYGRQKDALKFDALVADVHTSPDVGALHVATGPVSLMVVVIDRGADTMAYAGPVSSYFEFVPEGQARLNDDEWKTMLREKRAPPRPEWTKDWLVAGDHPPLNESAEE